MKELSIIGYPITSSYIHAIYKLARTLSFKYNVPQDYEDICQLALLEAIRLEPQFDVTKGASFMTFIRRPVTQVVQKYYGYSKSTTKLYNKILKFMSDYEKESGVLPLVDTIAKALKITELEVTSLYYGRPLKVSLDILGEDEVSVEHAEHPNEYICAILESLSDTDKEFVTLHFLQEHSLQELSVLYKVPVKELSARLQRIIRDLKSSLGNKRT